MKPLALLLFLAGSALAADSASLLHSIPITARSTFEVRFSAPMVPSDAVGKPAASPLVVRPALPGTFTWLGERSGVFTPTEPMTLNTTYQITLESSLAKADGQPLEATLSETVGTPPFGIKGRVPQNAYTYNGDAPTLPPCTLLFNAAVDPAKVLPFVYFTDKVGNCIPARLGDEKEPNISIWASKDHSALSWDEQFRLRTAEEESKASQEHRSNVLSFVPSRALPPGEDWKMVAREGLPSVDGLHLSRHEEVAIGTIRPFVVSSVTTNNTVTGGRRIIVYLSKAMADEVKPETLKRWFSVSPEPVNLQARLDGNACVILTGNFLLHTDYTVTVAAGLPAKEPLALPKDEKATVFFEQIESTVALEAYEAHQLAGGSRKLRINTVNVPSVHVVAKVFQPDTAVGAEEEYRQYFTWHRHDDRNERVDIEKLPGRTTIDQDFQLKGAVDQDEVLELNWDDIVGAGRTGVAMITVEAVDRVGPDARRPGAQSLVQLTDLGVVWKDSPSEMFAHVFSLASGTPVEGAKVQWMDGRGKVRAEAKSDAAGTVRLPVGQNGEWLVVTHGKDLHVIEQDSRSHFQRGRFRVAWDGVGLPDEVLYGGESGDQRQVLLFTERPVYKPGETVHLKAIVRDERPGHAVLAAGEEVTLEARDARDRVFVSRKLKISDVGSLADDIVLPSGPNGGYSARLHFAGEDADLDHVVEFRVEEYVPNVFEVAVETPRALVGAAEADLAVHAKYYMGKPLSKAKAAWSLSAQDAGFAPEGWGKFAFCDLNESWRLKEVRAQTAEFKDQGELAIDEKGEARFARKIPLNTKAPQPRNVTARAEVTDVDQQTVSNTATFTVHSSDYYLGIGEVPDVLHEGDSLSVQLAAVRADGTPIQEGVDAQVRLLRVDWQTNRAVTSGYADGYRSTPELVPVSSAPVHTSAVKKEKKAWIIPAGAPAAAQFKLPQPGEYLLEASGKDAAGREMFTTRSVYVYGQGATVWNYRNQFQVDLMPDKDEYFAGDTATILVKTPIAGDALVTVERENVRRFFVTKLEGNAPSVKIPVEPGDAPNVYVSVIVLRGADASTHRAQMPEYRVGYAALNVKRRDAELNVYAKPTQPKYEPGQEVEVNVEVQDSLGHAVSDAEVTLYAVDEGVLSLMGYETPAPFKFFNNRRALSVDTGLTLPDLMPEDMDERSFGNKGYLVGDGGEESNERLRKEFIACAYWNATLRTDADGKLAVKFKAPDSLTRYRVMAVVQTARDQFGSTESAFEVQKPVMIEAAPPRFGNVGDRLSVRAVIHNMTEQTGDAVVSLELDGTATSHESLTRTVALAARGSVAVDFPVEFVEAGEAVWKWSVKFVPPGEAAHRDAMESRLSVGYPTPMLRQVLQGRAAAGETDLLAGADPALLEGAGVIHVRFSNSRLLEMREGLDQLLHYPYGCVEQTTSSTLPWISVRQLGPVLPALARSDAEVQQAIHHGVERLLSMQTPSGGLAYWPGGSEPLLYASAYGGFGLACAKKAGAAVPEEEFSKLMAYLSQTLRGSGGPEDASDVSSQCLGLLTLAIAGHAEPAYHERFFQKRDRLDAQQRACLALAILEANGPRDMAKTLLEQQNGADTDHSDWWCGSRTTSLQLMAWCRLDREAARVDALLADLLGERRGGHWYTTQGNAWAVLALAEYAQRVERERGLGQGTLLVNGERSEFRLDDKNLWWSKDIPLKPGAVPKLVLSHTGPRLFTDVTLEIRPKQAPPARSDRGYTITRRYQRVADDGTLSEARDLRVGERVLVTLDVSVSNNGAYLAIEDPLPANLEAINPKFASQAAMGGELTGQPWASDFHELRTDRALFFVNQYWRGNFYIRYLARVRAAGTAIAPAAKVEEMYEPDHFGTTATGLLSTSKWD